MKTIDQLQWTMSCEVWHARDYGHKLQVSTYRGTYGEGKHYSAGTWKGLGVPGLVLQESRSLIDGIWSEYLIHRYGIQEELPIKWAGEPDPF